MFSFQEWKAVESIMEDVVICASWRRLVPHAHALMESQWSRIRRHAVAVSSEEYIHDRLVKIWCHNTRPIDNNIKLKSIRQFGNHAQLLKERNSGGPQHSQLDVLYERLAATKASKVWFLYSHNCTLSNGAVFHVVCQVWLSIVQWPARIVHCCAWLWNWIMFTVYNTNTD